MKKNTVTKWCGVVAVVALSVVPGRARSEDKKDAPKDNVGNYRVEGIDVVQGRVFKKGYRHEFGVDAGIIANNTFLMYELVGLKYTYHFREGLAFEGAFWNAFNQQKAILDDLENIPSPPGADCDGNGVVDQTEGKNCGVALKDNLEPIERMYFGHVVYSPIYGKFAIFSKKIFHFDLFFLAGAGVVDTKGPNRFGFNVGAGFKIFMNDWMTVRLDFRNFTVREGQPFNQISNNRMVSLGVGFFLPPHPVNQ